MAKGRKKRVPKRPANLTPKQKRFAEEYLVDLNATQAAIRAGYSAKAAKPQGARLLTYANLVREIAKGVQRRSARTEVTADRVVEELAKLAFSDIEDYLQIRGDGTIRLDFSAIPEGATAAISEIVQDVYMDGKGEDAEPVKKTKFKLHDKLGALNLLGKHLKMFIERHEHSGPDGGPIEYAGIRERLASRLAQRDAAKGPAEGDGDDVG